MQAHPTRTPLDAEAVSLAAICLAADAALEWLPADSPTARSLAATLDSLRPWLAERAADAPLPPAAILEPSIGFYCPACSIADGAIMGVVDALAFQARAVVAVVPDSLLPGMCERMIGVLRAAVGCPDCATRPAGRCGLPVLDRTSDRRPRRPKAAR